MRELKKTDKKEYHAPRKKKSSYTELEDVGEPVGILDEEDFSESRLTSGEDNPFKELENLITSKDIEVKTFLTDRQVVVMHKLGNLYDIYQEAGETSSAKMIKNYARTFMTLIINKNGLSRTQYIEAIGRGREKAEESRREKMMGAMGNML